MVRVVKLFVPPSIIRYQFLSAVFRSQNYTRNTRQFQANDGRSDIRQKRVGGGGGLSNFTRKPPDVALQLFRNMALNALQPGNRGTQIEMIDGNYSL